jgi:hypothetical protein
MYFMKQNNTSSVQKYRYLANYTVVISNVQLLFKRQLARSTAAAGTSHV